MLTFYGTTPTIIKEGKHYTFDDLEYWAEDGVICIVDTRDGEYKAVTCLDFAKRAEAINEEARRATLPSDRLRLQNCVLDMHEAWKEAKSHGDPGDPEVVKQRIRERRRAIMVTGW